MFMTLRMKLRGYTVQDFNYLELLDCRYKDYRWTLDVKETDKAYHFNIDDYEDIFDIMDRVLKEENVEAVMLTDYKTHKYYYKVKGN